MDVQITPMEMSHAKDVQRLSEQLGYPLSLKEIEANMREIGLTENNCSFVAILEERVVGWVHAFRAMLIESRPFIEIGGLIVDENLRGKGVGTKLVGRIRDWSSEKGVGEIRVRSNVKRKEAHEFYTGLGFTEVKQQKVFELHI